MKKKILVTTGSRSDYGILKPVINEIAKSKKLDLILIASGMHLSKKHGTSLNEIKQDGFKIHATVDMIPKGNSTFDMAKALSKGIEHFSNLFNKFEPDVNLILGDRDEAFASALAASHMNIINAHIHGGDKSKAGIDEYNRHAITKISNLHFAATKKSQKRIIKMGENPKFVFFTGSPSIDDVIKQNFTSKKHLEKKFKINFKGDEIILLQHSVTTETEKTEIEILNTLNAILKTNKITIAIAPNSDAGNKQIYDNILNFSENHEFITMFKNLPRTDFLGLLNNCGVLVGNSSSGIIEASYFNIPVINIGIRQNDREHGSNVININSNVDSIYSAIQKALKSKTKNANKKKILYGNGNASKKIVKILEKTDLNKELLQKQIFY